MRLHFLPVATRVPLKFGHETLTSVTCARVAVGVVGTDGVEAQGWGETPLSVQWVWPSALSYEERHHALKKFCQVLAETWIANRVTGHPLEIGHAFLEDTLPDVLAVFNEAPNSGAGAAMPWLAALVCNSAFDIALHDAFGKLAGRPVDDTYSSEFLEARSRGISHPRPGFLRIFHGPVPF